jgi:DNA-binding CsgD family transcriptional regulator/tetratricopeptide (TPR) repeat protein
LIGRDNDLRSLRAVMPGNGLTSVLGSPGLGKTALVRAALAPVTHREGGALRSLVNRQYLPLERALQVSLEGDAQTVAETVIARLGQSILFVDDVHWAHPRCVEVLDLVRIEKPVVVASRREGLGDEGAALVASGAVVELAPLSDDDARALARTLHPSLAQCDLEQLVTIAAGSPLLLELLVQDQQSSPTLIEALSARVAHLDRRTRDALAELALVGRPIDPAVLRLDCDAFGLVEHRHGLVQFRHALIADAALATHSAEERQRLHAHLGTVLSGSEAIRHLLAAGEGRRALVAAREAGATAVDAGERADLAYLVAVAGEAIGAGDARSWLDAAALLVAGGRYDDAIEAARHAALDETFRPEARYVEGRARWFLGDPDAAAACFDAALAGVDAGTTLATRILVERAYVEIRARRPNMLEIATEAFAAAEHDPIERLRAQAGLGAALLYAGRPGWDETLATTVDEATRAGDVEVACTAAFHRVSGLGFFGRLREAIDLGNEQLAITEAHGLETWRAHFLTAQVLNSMLAGEDRKWVIATSAAMLEEHPLFRNRFQSEAALVVALADMGDLGAAQTAAREHLQHATTDEARLVAHLCLAEVLFLEADSAAVLDVALRGRALGNAWFGTRIVLEILGFYAAVEMGRPFEPSLPDMSMPMHWPGLHEIEALRRVRLREFESALEELDHAALMWRGEPCPRWALRAEAAAATLALRTRCPGASERVKAVRARAQEVGLTHHLRRWGLLSDLGLTGREEQILRFVARGRTSVQIAYMLGITPGTVDKHVESARRKLGASTRREAARVFER